MSRTYDPDGQSPRKVVILAYDGAKLMDISGPLQAFNDAAFADGRPAYQVVLVSEAGGAVSTDTGVKLETVRLDDAVIDSVDTLLVAGGDLIMPAAATASLRAKLADYLDRPRRLGSVCTGAFVLAQLGVLDHRTATTHWAACNRLEKQHPTIDIKPDAIFVTSGHIWTSAGVSAGIDMALAMIEDDLDHLTALNVARGMVLFLKRPGGQSQFSVELRQQMRDARGRFDDLHDWIRNHLEGDLSIPALADAARMSPRNFARVYVRETGESPARAVERLRIEAARRLLESAHDPIQVIARRTGFGDDERMRRAFAKAYGVSPHDYRRRFGLKS
ncbi:GlxA family transcriptional regulator [Paraburkholderia azotifigens]|uniref:Helix-turn-helix domain-containing protein n=1 Tax=Paraburkholderia azotifigens TaxID=2057004 RepID=A0A5C6V4P6_9BURK|nr:helix-turn-helix domain-containing protein [Paraburkholderia azotifigens]TXC79541.1 helix-turn-helix domain-containing protein [Paraburkholderia azotifigens]